MNTGSLEHVTKTLKNAERNPRPSGDLIPSNMQSKHAPKEPQQSGSGVFSAFNLHINIYFSPAIIATVLIGLCPLCSLVIKCSHYYYNIIMYVSSLTRFSLEVVV